MADSSLPPNNAEPGHDRGAAFSGSELSEGGSHHPAAEPASAQKARKKPKKEKVLKVRPPKREKKSKVKAKAEEAAQKKAAARDQKAAEVAAQVTSAKTQAAQGPFVVRLGPEGWQGAHAKRNGGLVEVEARSENLRELVPPGGDGIIIAIPTHLVFGVPLWLATDDDSLVDSLAVMQLEKRGLAGPQRTGYWLEILRVDKMEDATLVLACVLAENFPRELCFIDVKGYEAAPVTYPVPHDSLACWKEKGRVVLAYRRGEKLACFQAFNGDEVTHDTATEMTCVLLELTSQEIMAEPGRLILFGAFSEEEANRLRNMLGLEIERRPEPGLSLPSRVSYLLPGDVIAARKRRRQRKRMQRILLTVGATYLLLLLGVAGYLFWYQSETNTLKAEIAENEMVVQKIEETDNRWSALVSAVDPSSFAVEKFFRAASLLPEEGVRFQEFFTDSGKIVIEGEARSFREAQTYFQELEKQPDLQAYKWNMDKIEVQNDGRAEFVISGQSTTVASVEP